MSPFQKKDTETILKLKSRKQKLILKSLKSFEFKIKVKFLNSAGFVFSSLSGGLVKEPNQMFLSCSRVKFISLFGFRFW